MTKFYVNVRIVTPHKQAIYEKQLIEADTGLDAMKAAQADEKNTKRGSVSTQGAEPAPADTPIMETKGEDGPRRSRPPRNQVSLAD